MITSSYLLSTAYTVVFCCYVCMYESKSVYYLIGYIILTLSVGNIWLQTQIFCADNRQILVLIAFTQKNGLWCVCSVNAQRFKSKIYL